MRHFEKYFDSNKYKYAQKLIISYQSVVLFMETSFFYF